MSSGMFPDTDAGLLAFSLNFKTLITSSPTVYGLTAPLAAAYGALHDAYATALAACDPAIRTRSAVATKDASKQNLKVNARLLASLIDGTASVTVAQKLALGLNVRSLPSPIPPPAAAPALDVVSATGWTVRVRLHDATTAARRGKPAGVAGAAVFSYVGATAPSDLGGWKFEGNTGLTTVDVAFPDTLAAGTKIWLCAFWFNPRKQGGPACAPVAANLPGGSVSTLAA